MWRLEVHAELGSTSDRIAALAAAGEPAGLAVLALRQTAARGSRGRGWQSPVGNLSLSVLLRPAGDVMAAGRWSLLAAVALAETASALLPDPAALELKWPNDVLLRRRKLAGILIDTAVDGAGALRWLILGMGVNLAVAPEVPGRATAALAEEGIEPPAPEPFARALLDRLAAWEARSLPDLHAAWLARAHPLGTPLAVAYGAQRLEGRFAGLSPEGHLLLDTADGRRTLATGEVLLSPT
jgi:BirA family biotin operon repressor/biotin-[acetyl-CoA-carboxylase] ligase